MSRALAALYHELAEICTASLPRQSARCLEHKGRGLTTGLVALISDAHSPSAAADHPALQEKQQRVHAGTHIGAHAVATATANAARSASKRSPPLDSLTHIRRRFRASLLSVRAAGLNGLVMMHKHISSCAIGRNV